MLAHKAQVSLTALVLIAFLLLAGFGFYVNNKISESKATAGKAEAGSREASPAGEAQNGSQIEKLIEVLHSASEYVFSENKVTVTEKISFGSGRYEDEV
ncbi:MAG: hypothetical protein QW343_03295, partial [Candidatus Norongarragalinales archaeon]